MVKTKINMSSRCMSKSFFPIHEEWDRAKREAEARSEEEAKQALAGKDQFIEAQHYSRAMRLYRSACLTQFQGSRQREARADISFVSFPLQGPSQAKYLILHITFVLIGPQPDEKLHMVGKS